MDSAQHLISCICYDCICYDCAILNACVQCCSLSLPSSLCPQFPVFAKLLGVRVFRDTSSCSWTPGLVSYYDCRSHIILVYSFCLCNFNIDDVLQLNVSPPPHTHTHAHTPTEQPLMQSAGVDCLTSLCQLLGRMIFRGRTEQHNPM